MYTVYKHGLIVKPNFGGKFRVGLCLNYQSQRAGEALASLLPYPSVVLRLSSLPFPGGSSEKEESAEDGTIENYKGEFDQFRAEDLVPTTHSFKRSEG
jgi:hypothetical protein